MKPTQAMLVLRWLKNCSKTNICNCGFKVKFKLTLKPTLAMVVLSQFQNCSKTKIGLKPPLLNAVYICAPESTIPMVALIIEPTLATAV